MDFLSIINLPAASRGVSLKVNSFYRSPAGQDFRFATTNCWELNPKRDETL